MASNTINLSTYRAKLLSNTYGANNSPIYINAGVPTVLTTVGSTTLPVWSDGGVLKGITSYEGNAATASKWQTARALTIGGTAHDVDGSAAVSWTKDEILGSSTSAYFLRGDKAWSNTLIGDLYINSSTDVGKDQNGALIIGNKGGTNIGIDDNEIMARNNSAVSTLYINNEGGAIQMGSGGLNVASTIHSTAGLLKSTLNSNTVTIGSQNASFCHIYNSANIPFIFNNTIETTSGTLGTTTYRWGTIYGKGQPGVDITLAAGSWAYIRLNNSSNYWDIATKSDHQSGALELRNNGSDTGYYFHTGDMPAGVANMNAAAVANSIKFYRNGMLIPNPGTINDGGFIRVKGTGESDTILELGTWDDYGTGETIQFNYYPTTSQVTPTYSVSVPKESGVIFTRREWWTYGTSHDANDLRHGCVFAYASQTNCPTTGTLVAFDCAGSDAYPLQLQGAYGGEALYYRNRNGDNGTWQAWRRLVHEAGTWGISISGDANTVDGWHRDDIRKGCLSFTRNINSANPTNLNSLNDGMAYNYGSGGYWQHAPSSPTYGSCIALTSGGTNTLGGQFYWDINHNSSSSTRSLWFRAANNLGWQDDWKQIVWNSGSWSISVTGSSGSCTGNAASSTTAYNLASIHGNECCVGADGAASLWINYRNHYNGNNSGTQLLDYYFGDRKYSYATTTLWTGAICMSTSITSKATSQPMAISYGRVQCYGTLCINANTDNSGTEYVILTAGHGCSSSTSEGFWVGSNSAGCAYSISAPSFYISGAAGSNNCIQVGSGDANGNGGANWVLRSWYGIGIMSGCTSINNGVITAGVDARYGYIYSGRTYNAVWNDFAEFRESEVTEPGRVLISNGQGQMVLCDKRLVAGAKVISDTYGCSVGQSNTANTPLGVAGRVLVYTYQDRNNYRVGDAICAAPNGTVDIMTREEIKEYPDRIIGIVDEIPTYKKWEQYRTCQNEDGESIQNKVSNTEIKGRIWIYVR